MGANSMRNGMLQVLIYRPTRLNADYCRSRNLFGLPQIQPGAGNIGMIFTK